MNDLSNPTIDSETASKKLRCTVIELTKCSGPGGAEGRDWYRYVIHNPGAPITGYRRGKKKEILEYLEQCTTQLEERINPRKPARKR